MDPVHVSSGLALKSTGVKKKWESLGNSGLTSTPSIFSPFSTTPTWHLPRAGQGSERDATWFYCSNKIQEKNPETTQRNKPGRSQEVAGSDWEVFSKILMPCYCYGRAIGIFLLSIWCFPPTYNFRKKQVLVRLKRCFLPEFLSATSWAEGEILVLEVEHGLSCLLVIRIPIGIRIPHSAWSC